MAAHLVAVRNFLQRTATGEALLGTWDFEAGTSQSVTLTNAADGYVAVNQLQVLPAGRSGPVTDAELSLVFVHADHLGTPQMLTDGSGGIAWSGAYAPFGAVVAEEGAVDNALRFPGQLRDVETDSHYNYFRYYETSTGRYASSDPGGLEGGFNPYAYSEARPISRVDPLGLVSWEVTLSYAEAAVAAGRAAKRIGVTAFSQVTIKAVSECVDSKQIEVTLRDDNPETTGIFAGGVVLTATLEDGRLRPEPGSLQGSYRAKIGGVGGFVGGLQAGDGNGGLLGAGFALGGATIQGFSDPLRHYKEVTCECE